jgi:proteasome component ECM29
MYHSQIFPLQISAFLFIVIVFVQIDLYHKEILADLLANLTASQWRVRMSCCLALADFLRVGGSRSMCVSVDNFPSLWAQLFRVMDDVHEGTRHAAENTTRVLSKVCDLLHAFHEGVIVDCN